MTANFIRIFLSIAVFATVSAVAEEADWVDDQTVVGREEFEVANPRPLPRNFRANNAAHRVLMAVIDTGLDYNHPILAHNLHFRLDGSGQPTGLGFDFVGNDHWPSPYLVSTSRYNTDVPPAARRLAEAQSEALTRFLARAPDLGRFMDSHRALQQEYDSGIYHGSHVAGLMVYDRPDFGLIAYRILPMPKTGRLSKMGESLFGIMLLKATEVAIGEGARIINFSLGDTLLLPGKGEPKRPFNRQRALMEKFRMLAANNPNVLFITAAGNEGQWMDRDNRSMFPCEAPSANVLCVGALRADGNPTNFTNVILSHANIVYAFGEEVMSTVPTGQCVAPSVEWKDLFDEKGDLKRGVDQNIAALNESCLRKRAGWMRLSGTSMASPLVAHLAGEILAAEPTLTGAQVIAEIQKRSIPGQIGQLAIKKVAAKRPSWYQGAWGGSN
ncbi:MAG: S8 family serine peptidase [Bdellovibrionia bacterium]